MPLRIQKRDTEKERLVKQLDKQERTIRDAFLAFVSVVKSDVVLSEVNALLAVGDIEGALAIVDTHLVRLSGVLTTVFNDVGVTETDALKVSIGTAAAGISFDPNDARAADIMTRNRLQFVSQTTEAQRNSTRQAMVRSFEQGDGPRKTAAAFRDSLGLTANQEKAVQNYKKLLENNSAQALQRDIRDRRFDRTVANAIKNDEPLSNKQINRMVDRYRERFVQFRAEVVARTEGTRTTSQARQESLEQMLEETGIEESAVVRTWNRTNDNRVRDSHDVMQGQKSGLKETFTDGDGNELLFPGDTNAPLETTAQCRCVVTVRFKS